VAEIVRREAVHLAGARAAPPEVAEIGTVERSACPGREDQSVLARLVPLEVTGENVDYGLRGRDRAHARRRFRRSEHGWSARRVDELAVDTYRTSQEVNTVDREPERLTGPQPCARQQHDQCPIPLGDTLDDGADLLGGHRQHLGAMRAR